MLYEYKNKNTWCEKKLHINLLINYELRGNRKHQQKFKSEEITCQNHFKKTFLY